MPARWLWLGWLLVGCEVEEGRAGKKDKGGGEPYCAGSETECWTYGTAGSCNSQDGCIWDHDGPDCYGNARTCDYFDFNEYDCVEQEGCTWQVD